LVKLHDLRAGLSLSLSYQMVLTMQFFRNNANVPLFLTRVRTSHSQPYKDWVITHVVTFACTVLDLLLSCARIGLFCYKCILHAWWQHGKEGQCWK